MKKIFCDKSPRRRADYSAFSFSDGIDVEVLPLS
jgi:hypothetical protein